MVGIYQIRNITNNKVYVGSSKNMANRRSTHRFNLRRGTHHSTKLQKAWDEFGERNFIFETLEIITDKNKLLERERYYRDLLKSEDEGYNIKGLASDSSRKK